MNGSRIADEFLAEEFGVDYDEVTATANSLTEYDVWFHENEEAILIELAESGADRELDFNLEAEFDKRFQKYLAK